MTMSHHNMRHVDVWSDSSVRDSKRESKSELNPNRHGQVDPVYPDQCPSQDKPHCFQSYQVSRLAVSLPKQKGIWYTHPKRWQCTANDVTMSRSDTWGFCIDRKEEHSVRTSELHAQKRGSIGSLVKRERRVIGNRARYIIT